MTEETREAKWPLDSVERWRALSVRAWAAIGVAVLIWMVLSIIARISGVLMPFLLAAILVYLMRPVVGWVEGRGIPRLVAVGLTYLVVTAVLATTLALLIPPLVAQVQGLIRDFDTYWRAAVAFAQGFRQGVAQMRFPESVGDWLNDVPARLEELGAAFAQFAGRQAFAVGGFVMNAFLAPVIAFYVLTDLPRLRTAVTKLMPRDHRPEFLEILGKIDVVATGYLKGHLIGMILLAIMTFVGFTIASFFGYGLPYALALSFMAGVLNVIPYFGPWATAIVAAVVGLFISPWHAVVGFVVIMGAQQIEATFIAPYVMSNAVDVHPALVLFALMVGGSLFGIMGLILAIPVAAATKVVFLHFYEKYVPPDDAPAVAESAAEEAG